MTPAQTLELLEEYGVIAPDGDEWRTTRRWQSAMVRSALRLYAQGELGDDLRVPIAAAVIDLLGATLGDKDLADCVAAMLPIEVRSLGLVRER